MEVPKEEVTRRTFFKMKDDYHGRIYVEELVKHYSRNGLLKLLGVRSWKFVIVDLEKQEMRLTDVREEDGGQTTPENTFHFEEISSIKLDISRAAHGHYYMIIQLENGTINKLKFFSRQEFRNVVELLRAMVTYDGSPMLNVKDDYDTLEEHHGISSEEEDEVPKRKKPLPAPGKYEDEQQVLERQEKDDEYAYLRWKFIEKFENFGSPLPMDRLMPMYNREHGVKTTDPKVSEVIEDMKKNASLTPPPPFMDTDEVYASTRLGVPVSPTTVENSKKTV